MNRQARGYQVVVAFGPWEPDAYRAALVHLPSQRGRPGYWGYSAPGASQPALLTTTASDWQGPLVSAWARCLEVSTPGWPDRAAHGSYLDVSVYEADPAASAGACLRDWPAALNDGPTSRSSVPLVLREHLVGQRTRHGLRLSFADDTDYLEMQVPVELALEDLEPGPGALLAQAVCAIDGELAALQRAASSCSPAPRRPPRNRRRAARRP